MKFFHICRTKNLPAERMFPRKIVDKNVSFFIRVICIACLSDFEVIKDNGLYAWEPQSEILRRSVTK
jgi:hypothetical protein